MELRVQRNDLARELSLVQGIVERKSSIPILQNVLCEAKSGELRIAATDLDVSLRCGCPAEIVAEGSVTLAAKKLYEIVRSLPEKEVSLKLESDSWARIKCDRVDFRMAGLPREDFPTLPEPKGGRAIEVPAHAGTAFDGTHLYEMAEKRIQKIDPKSGRVLSTIPSPGEGKDSGLAWAELSGGTVCVYQGRIPG